MKALLAVVIVSAAIASCNTGTAYDRLMKARQLSADLFVQFTKAADSANKAVMADTDDASVAFAKQADETKSAVQADIDALRPVLEGLGYTEETRFLQEFAGHFTKYRELDRQILDLAVQNTNLKAQRLSFGEAQMAADAFAASLEAIGDSAPQNDAWRVKALVAGAVADLRAIQVAQAPHIAEPTDEVMTKIEQRMADDEKKVRAALDTLRPLVAPSARSHLTDAAAALDRFLKVNAEIVALSRRNTNVRSLMLSLNEKGKATSACEMSLRALQDALGKRGVTGSR